MGHCRQAGLLQRAQILVCLIGIGKVGCKLKKFVKILVYAFSSALLEDSLN
jgi:hypothetical protein